MIVVNLVDDFVLTHRGTNVELPLSSRRLVAYVALADRPVRRSRAGAELWPDSCDERARANLRSTLWRVAAVSDVLAVTPSHLALRSSAVVDYRGELAELEDVLDHPGDSARETDLARRMCAGSGELLVDWTDDWVSVERERYRQARRQAMDALGIRLCETGNYRDALRVGFAAMRADPLRESPHRLIMRVHLGLGNVADAIRQFRTYERLLCDELGVRPSPAMTALLPGRPVAVSV